MTRWVIILMVAIATAAQAPFGGIPGVSAICLGTGASATSDQDAGCESACSHADRAPTPSTDHDHRDGCGCVDIELTLAQLFWTPKQDDRPAESSPPVTPVVFGETRVRRDGPLALRRPTSRGGDPGLHLDGRARVVRSTRLII